MYALPTNITYQNALFYAVSQDKTNNIVAESKSNSKK